MTEGPPRVPHGLPAAVLATGRRADAEVLAAALRHAGQNPVSPPGLPELVAALPDAGCLVVAQESLGPRFLDAVGQALAGQPGWSELPILVLTAAEADGLAIRDTLARRWPHVRVTVYARPVQPVELLTGVQLAVSTRLKQFRIRDQLVQEEELRRELNHRVKNILTTVQAIATMSQRSGGPPDALFDDFQARLTALSTVHATLHGDYQDGVPYTAVLDGVIKPYDGAVRDRVTVEAPATLLTPEAAKTLALCLHELTTNAVKYGALSGAGTIRTALSGDNDHATLRWEERGGPPVTPPTRTGYGTRFLTGALRGLFNARPRLDYAPGGFRLVASGRAPTLFQA